jgi:predicted Rossmann fold flavoprotein
VKGALARYSSADFIGLVKRYRIPHHEKHQGQLFCDDSAKDIIAMLFAECQQGGVTIRNPVSVEQIQSAHGGWEITTNQGIERTKAVVMATGGLPVPAIGASDYALGIAKQFDLPVVPVRPALVPLSFTSDEFTHLSELAGLSVPVRIAAGTKAQRYGHGDFYEDLLITHKGLSGPAVLQASSYWIEGESIAVNWLGAHDIKGKLFNCDALFDDPDNRLKQTETILAIVLPQRLAKAFAQQQSLLGRKWAEVGKKDRQTLKAVLQQWTVKPAGTLGWKKAEVMLGGVDTKALDSQTMMAKAHPGLYFIGECVDVTGHLGGHNFQWAWSSGFACAHALAAAQA